MNNQEAKFLLTGYRPNGRDAGDAMFNAAIKQTREDPSLGAWFAHEQAYDRVVASRLAEIAPPPGLREAILAGTRASGEKPAMRQRAPVWVWGGLAAAVVLMIGLSFWAQRGNAASTELANFVLTDAANAAAHHGHGNAAHALEAYLEQPTTQLTRGLPVDFAALKSTGCRTLTFAGVDVMEICFKRDGRWFHFYAIDTGRIQALRNQTHAALMSRDGFCCASWTDAKSGIRFVVAGQADTEDVRRLL